MKPNTMIGDGATAADVRDAERYRWLRDNGGPLAVCDEETSYYAGELDAVLDAAMNGANA